MVRASGHTHHIISGKTDAEGGPGRPKGRSNPIGFIVRVKSHTRLDYEFLASNGYTSFADLTIYPDEAWRFPNRKSALLAAHLALGMRARYFNIEIVPVQS
jgi:hypothetical protein